MAIFKRHLPSNLTSRRRWNAGHCFRNRNRARIGAWKKVWSISAAGVASCRWNVFDSVRAVGHLWGAMPLCAQTKFCPACTNLHTSTTHRSILVLWHSSGEAEHPWSWWILQACVIFFRLSHKQIQTNVRRMFCTPAKVYTSLRRLAASAGCLTSSELRTPFCVLERTFGTLSCSENTNCCLQA